MTGFARLVLLPALLAGLHLGLLAVSADAQQAAENPPELPKVLLNPNIDTDELSIRLIPLTKPELAALADAWLKIVKAKTEEVMEAQVKTAQYGGPLEDAAREVVTQLAGERKSLFDKYTMIVNSWEKKGGDPDAIADFRAYRSSIIIEETRTADYKTLIAESLSWTTSADGGLRLVRMLAIIAVSILGLWILAKIIQRATDRWIGRVPNLSKLLQAFLVTVVYWLVLAIGLMVVLSAVGIDVTPVFALIGGASFIMAFAFQDTLGNLASGLMIMINRPFDEGDFVDVGGVAGTVKSVSIVATTVTTPDNQVIVIPNKQVWGNIITNITTSATRRVDLVFGISYEDSIAEAQAVLEDVTSAHPLVLEEPEPVIKVHALADSSVNFVCRPWVRTEDYWTVYWDLTRQMKERFDAAGISIPYPQRDVHVKGAESRA